MGWEMKMLTFYSGGGAGGQFRFCSFKKKKWKYFIKQTFVFFWVLM